MQRTGPVFALIALPMIAMATSVPMKECVNCTSAQMQTMAKNSQPGIAFIYDLSHNVIRKFEVWTDSTCANDPMTEALGEESDQTRASSNRLSPNAAEGSAQCGSFRDAAEVSPVDTDIQNIFNSLRAVWLVNPTLASTGKATRAGVPVNTSDHQPFDLVKVAWEYPQGYYVDFIEQMRDSILVTKGEANAFMPGLGDELFGVSIKVNAANVGFPEIIQVTVSLDKPNATIHLDICNNNGDCVKLDVKIINGVLDDVKYNGTFDVYNMMYPSESGVTPGSIGMWHWGNSLGADHFRQGLVGRGVAVPPAPGCNVASGLGWKLVVARVNGVIDSAHWTCAPIN